VTIDVLKILGADSVFLQQASHLTSGTYFRLRDPRGLLQTLLVSSVHRHFCAAGAHSAQTMYLPSPSTRPFMNLPNQDEVDFRAACFCHRRIVDVGYVCSVCLSSACYRRGQPCARLMRLPSLLLAEAFVLHVRDQLSRRHSCALPQAARRDGRCRAGGR
jgi:hypothetical protein